MKKIISVILSFALIAITAVTASAAGIAKFNINLVSETDKEAVVSIDFEGGTAFSGLDFEVIFDSKRVKIISAEKGNGFDKFSDQSDAAFAMINKDINPAKATLVTVTPFRVVEGKDLFVIKLKKLSKETLSNNDFKIVITNCIDGSQQVIKTSVTTDLQGAASSQTTTSQAAAPSQSQGKKPAAQASTSSISSSSSTPAVAVEEPIYTNGIEPDSEVIDTENEIAEQKEEETKDTDFSGKTVVVITGALVFVALAVAISIVLIKKKKPEIEE